MSLKGEIRKIIRKIAYRFYDIRKVYKMVTDPQLSQTYYPEEERKSKLLIWTELMLWQLKHNEANWLYYAYGLDRKISSPHYFIPYKKFNRLRNSRNQTLPREHFANNDENYNYICVLRDKFLFGQFLESLHFPTPQNIALFTNKEFTWLNTMKTVPLASVLQDDLINIDGFAKKLSGVGGDGAFTLRLKRGKLFYNDKEVTREDFALASSGQYLFQNRVTQHTKMAELHPSSLNTIRLLTFNVNGKVEPLTAALRIGVGGKTIDNTAAGGIAIGINLENGKLHEKGIYKPGGGGRVGIHPDSKIILEDFEVPFFKESVEMAIKLHSYLYGIHSIGWDIGITPEGPVFIEGNDNWETGILMALDHGFKSRVLKMYPGAEK